MRARFVVVCLLVLNGAMLCKAAEQRPGLCGQWEGAVQIPGYEAVHELIHDAVSEGVIAPSISSGFYLQCEIWDVLKWAKYRTSARRDTVERKHRCIVSH